MFFCLVLNRLLLALFDEEMQNSQEKALPAEEAGTIDVYEALEKMPFFWQRSDLEEEHLRTLSVLISFTPFSRLIVV